MAVTVHRAAPMDAAPVDGALVITERLYWDETKTRLLAEGHPDARFLAYAEGTAVPAALARQVGLDAVERVLAEAPAEPVPAEAEKPSRRRRTREDRQVAPGVVADTSIDGVARTLAAEPGSSLRNGADK